MVAWANLISMIITAPLTLLYYARSVSPAALERKIGEAAYPRCTRYRTLSGVFMILHFLGYVIYYFFPLPLPVPRRFPWPRRVSVLTAALIALPTGLLMALGMKDAGEETAIVKKEHTLYRGIYRKIRHPQMAGEVFWPWVFALLLDSPFLALFSVLWVPLFALMAWAEERDLVLRYGDAYREYRDRTGAVIPRGLFTLGRLR